ncbi:MAG: chromosomal replication initiator protein DnaA [Phycisphaerales bacterium]|nr:chromosomal replication initiator protein DnaA [Phycisphaerales bacterium]
MSAPDRAIWDDILADVRRRHIGLSRRWFDEIECLGVEAGALWLRVPQNVRRQYLERECAGAFAEAAQNVSGLLLSVRFVGDEAERPSAQRPAARAGATERRPTGPGPAPIPAAPSAAHNGEGAALAEPKPMPRAPAASVLPPQRRADDTLVISPDFTFDNFITGPENRLAHAAAFAVSENPGRAYNPVFLHGGVGLGKTHLLQAICSRVLERQPSAAIHYVSCEAFITQYIDAVQSGEMASFRHRFRDVDVLVIDDIHFLAQRERTQEEFFHTFNSLFQSHKQIVLSSDAPPDQIPDLEERLVSRFKWGLVAELEKPGYETRVAIVKNKAALRGVDMPASVAEMIAQRIDTNIRELEGAIVRAQMLSQVESAPISREMAERILRDAPVRSAPQMTISGIMETVADFYSLKLSDLQGKRRQKSVAQPRQVCMFFGRKYTSLSLEEIGGYFGGRDHTTVMHAVRTIEKRVRANPQLAEQIRTLEDRLLRPSAAG